MLYIIIFMNFLKFIIKNPFRRKNSAILSLVGIAIGIIVIVALGGITNGLTNSFENPNKLSGGERQRVAIARALANNPSIILADEPTGSLDSNTSNKILKLLIDLHKNKKVTLIIVTHDMNVAKLANRYIEVLDGKILSQNNPNSLINNQIQI